MKLFKKIIILYRKSLGNNKNHKLRIEIVKSLSIKQSPSFYESICD